MKTNMMTKIDKEVYESETHTIKREWDTTTPNGNKMHGRWVLRDKKGNMVDFNSYINDLAERHDIDLYSRSIKQGS